MNASSYAINIANISSISFASLIIHKAILQEEPLTFKLSTNID